MWCRKLFFGILVLLKINSTEISAQLPDYNASSLLKSSIFTESFENNKNDWFTDNPWINGSVVNGFYDLVCKNYQKSTGLSYKSIQIDHEKDFELETSFKVVRGTGGLIFGMTGKFDHYRVEIKDKSLFIIKDAISEKKIDNIFSGQVKSIIKNGEFNKITIRKIKENYIFFLNESYVGQFNNINPQGDQIGFSTNLNSEIKVDYLNVSYLLLNTSMVLSERNIPEKPDSSKSLIIEWISPSARETQIGDFSANIKANIKSASGLKDVFIYVNGVAARGVSDIIALPGDSGYFHIEKNISFNPGRNTIYLVATNDEGSKKSELRYFTIPSATLPAIIWKNPVLSTVSVNMDSFAIEVCIQSHTDLKSVKVIVNGDNRGEDNVFQKSTSGDCSYVWQRPVILKEGENDIFVQATNMAGFITSEKRIIRYQAELKEKRLALVFGNSEYTNKTTLKNPVNDANLMEATLEELGFKVIKKINATKKEMEEAIMEFNRNLPAYNVALFYYAGHGIQVDGINYLIPVDAKITDKTNCQWEAISVNDVVSEFKKHPDNINIAILDACRNNPFQNWVRGEEAGFKFLPNVSGTIIGYATVEGATAADGSGKNGLYTEELVKQMTIPQPVESAFKKTRVQVEIRSKGMQSPQETTGLRGDFYFRK